MEGWRFPGEPEGGCPTWSTLKEGAQLGGFWYQGPQKASGVCSPGPTDLRVADPLPMTALLGLVLQTRCRAVSSGSPAGPPNALHPSGTLGKGVGTLAVFQAAMERGCHWSELPVVGGM